MIQPLFALFKIVLYDKIPIVLTKYHAFDVIFLITNSVPTVRSVPRASVITALCTKPAMIYITNDIAATVIA